LTRLPWLTEVLQPHATGLRACWPFEGAEAGRREALGFCGGANEFAVRMDEAVHFWIAGELDQEKRTRIGPVDPDGHAGWGPAIY